MSGNDDDAPSKGGKAKKGTKRSEGVELVSLKTGADHAAHVDEPFATDGTLCGPVSFSEEAPLGPTFMKLSPQQTFLQGLFELDPSLVTNFKGRHGLFTRYTVLPGHLGLGSKYGQTKFFPPGNYYWTGVGFLLRLSLFVASFCRTDKKFLCSFFFFFFRDHLFAVRC